MVHAVDATALFLLFLSSLSLLFFDKTVIDISNDRNTKRERERSVESNSHIIDSPLL